MNCQKCGKSLSMFDGVHYVNLGPNNSNAAVCDGCFDVIYATNPVGAEVFKAYESNNQNEKEPTQQTPKIRYDNLPKATAAKSLRVISIIVNIVFAVLGGALGILLCPDEDLWIITIPVGAVIGFGIGFLITIFLRFLAELGENTKITAEHTMKSDIPSETEQIVMYKELLDKGAITQEEYNRKKKELLGL
ncbi:MAG: SHOCT domain-containing protein [Clostridia bacterium]|nr:SHOCT domain-containing protein [Clostridia bacterium]